jgi:hypothetical protein
VEVTTVGDTLLCGLVEGERNGSGKARMKKWRVKRVKLHLCTPRKHMWGMELKLSCQLHNPVALPRGKGSPATSEWAQRLSGRFGEDKDIFPLCRGSNHDSSAIQHEKIRVNDSVGIFFLSLAEISGFRREIDEICALLGYYAASCGNFWTSSRLNMGPIRYPETLVNNYHTTLCNIPQERRSLA